MHAVLLTQSDGRVGDRIKCHKLGQVVVNTRQQWARGRGLVS